MPLITSSLIFPEIPAASWKGYLCGGHFRFAHQIATRYLACWFCSEGMYETFPGKIAFGDLIQIKSPLVGQFLVRVDRIDRITKPLQIVVPMPMFFHEDVGGAARRNARGKNKNIALRLAFFRRLSVIKCLDHESIVNGGALIVL